MKETAAKRRDKAGRDRESKAEKSKEPAPQDVEMPEEETANAAKLPGELDSVTLDGNYPRCCCPNHGDIQGKSTFGSCGPVLSVTLA